MAKKSKRKNAKPPRKCIFCEGGGVAGNPMSEEHLWPEWMHRYLPKMEGAKKSSVYEIRRLNTVIQKHEKLGQGHIYTLTYKVVCKNCNETWMSRIEEDAKPILIPVLQGLPITLTPPMRTKLATWIALKVMVVEHYVPADAVLQQPDRAAFMELKKIPKSLKIWIATHDSEYWYTRVWHRTLVLSLNEDVQPATGISKNVQSTALGIGHLFSYSLINTVSGFDLDIGPVFAGNIARIWPLGSNAIQWPLSILSPAVVNRFSDFLGEFSTGPHVAWRPFSTRS